MFYNLTCKKLFIFFINDTDNLKPNWIIESRFKLISKKINLYLTKLIKRNTLFLINKRSFTFFFLLLKLVTRHEQKKKKS